MCIYIYIYANIYRYTHTYIHTLKLKPISPQNLSQDAEPLYLFQEFDTDIREAVFKHQVSVCFQGFWLVIRD